MKFRKIITAIGLSAMMILSVPVTGTANPTAVTVEAATKQCTHKSTTTKVTVKATCKSTGKKVTTCKNCKKVLKTQTISKTSHKLRKKLITEPTCKSTGKTAYVCTVCGTTTKTVTTPKISHQYASEVMYMPTSKKDGKIKESCVYCGKVKGYSALKKSSMKSIGTVKTTYYCGCDKCIDGNGTLTSKGQVAGLRGTAITKKHTIAVDTSVFPYGTRVLIDGVIYTAEDSGGGITGKHVDIYMGSTSASHYATERLGVENKTAYIIS